MARSLSVAPALVVIWLAAAARVSAGEVDAQSQVDAVTVYPDGATVTRVIQVNVPQGDTTVIARDFPPTLDPSSLRVEGEGGGRLIIGAIDVRPPRPERPVIRPELERKIEALRDEHAALDDTIAAATARKDFAIRFSKVAPAGLGEKGEARPLSEWRAAFVAVAEEVTAADDVIRKAKIKQRELGREIAELEAQRNARPPRKMEVRIDLAADAAEPVKLRVSYSVRGARWVPIYDARLESGANAKPALELVRRAEVIQNTGEDWDNVALSASTVRTAKGGNAPDLRPLIVQFYAPRPQPAPAPSVMSEKAARMAGTAQRAVGTARDEREIGRLRAAEEREATIETGGFQVVYRIPGRVTVATNEGAKSFRIGTVKAVPELITRAVPALDNTAFLEASFKHSEEAPLLPGRVAVYRDGTFIGRSSMMLTPKDEIVRLGFGADERVKVARVPVRRTEGSTGIISSSKIDEREFKITVRNGHATPVRISIEDQVPVSETDDVKVELLSTTTPPTQRDVRDRRGVIAWQFEAKPAELREIKLGWRVRWPADREVAYQRR